MEKEDLNLNEKVGCDVDDLLYDINKTIQKKYKLTWAKARDMVNQEIADNCCQCWIARGMYGIKLLKS